jgi:hypothetical protein
MFESPSENPGHPWHYFDVESYFVHNEYLKINISKNVNNNAGYRLFCLTNL